jgi:hypothetical protein
MRTEIKNNIKDNDKVKWTIDLLGCKCLICLKEGDEDFNDRLQNVIKEELKKCDVYITAYREDAGHLERWEIKLYSIDKKACVEVAKFFGGDAEKPYTQNNVITRAYLYATTFPTGLIPYTHNGYEGKNNEDIN